MSSITKLKKCNSIMYNSKVSPSRRLKNLLKPLLGHIFHLKKELPKRSSYIASIEKEAEFDWLKNDMDNMANEHLESRLLEEIRQCAKADAIIVYNQNGSGELQTMDQEDYYVPVHFARTNDGTFFWTSVQPQDSAPYAIEWNFLDRWAQA
ncbi:enhancer of split malpha protein [Drosophila guanche]|uniref:Blast:Enhancer of split malpha protein n=1 Tax=Drosophila guanche TaxID=7266 RepID=A0A3B0J372_DROGU|nr:enhancer of split malpha protein [Drosophila guanche]SPP76034.1 blast:Enhancer of split malpha protein [Drosophila guanche]